MRHRTATLLLWSCLIGPVCHATAPRAEWRHLAPETDGLPRGNFVQSLFGDSAGNLWVGTDQELGRYDGRAWRIFTVADGLPMTSTPPSPPRSSIRAIGEGPDGTIWCGTPAGAARLRGERWAVVPAGINGPGSDEIYCITSGRDGALLFGTAGGFSLLQDGHWFHGTVNPNDVIPGPGPALDVLAIIINPGDGYYFGTSREWANGNPPYSSVDGPNHDNRRLKKYFNSSVVQSLAGYQRPGWSRSDTLWLHTPDQYVFGSYTRWMGNDREGIVIDDGTNIRPLRKIESGEVRQALPGDVPLGSIFALHQDHRGVMWSGSQNVGAANGLTSFDGYRFTRVAFPGLAVGVSVRAILEDRRGYLWFGTTAGNLFRYDGTLWHSYDRASTPGLRGNPINSLHVTRDGNIWAATDSGLAVHDFATWKTLSSFVAGPGRVRNLFEDFDGTLWVTVSSGVHPPPIGGLVTLRRNPDGTYYASCATNCLGLPEGVAASVVHRDRENTLWVGTTSSGIGQYDGHGSVRLFGSDITHAGNMILQIAEDARGTLWVATDDGLARHDASGWTAKHLGPRGSTSNVIYAVWPDSSGEIWVGTELGPRRLSATLEELPMGVNPPNSLTRDIRQDRAGHIWCATQTGAARFDGERWISLQQADGLLSDEVTALAEDERGRLWFGGPAGISVEQPDRIGPRTIFKVPPPALTAGSESSAQAGVDLDEEGLSYAWSLDGAGWGPWSEGEVWRGTAGDGQHVLRVRARDRNGNVDPFPVEARFEVDGTPPAPRLETPADGSVLQGNVTITGTAADARFHDYRLEVRRAGEADWRALGQGGSPVAAGALGQWATDLDSDGDYELRLTVVDALGLAGHDTRRVTVDNVFPFMAQTSPAVVPAGTGGTVYTTDGRYAVTVPAHAFAVDVTVRVDTLAAAGLPETLAGGYRRAGGGLAVRWGADVPSRPLVLRAPARWRANGSGGAPPLFFRSDAGGNWRRIGGTADTRAVTVALPVRDAGDYGLFFPPEGGEADGPNGVADLSVSPRGVSAADLGAGRPLLISFTLRGAARVSVRVYDRRGVLVRRVVEDRPLTAGANLLTWDGRDEDSAVVADDLYFVAVEADGQVAQLAVAVSRGER